MSGTKRPFVRFNNLIEPFDDGYRERERLKRRFDKEQQRIKDLLFRHLSTKTMVAFVGSGCSKDLGYPNLAGLVKELLKAAPKTNKKKVKHLEVYSRDNAKIPNQVTYRTILSKCERLYTSKTAFREKFQQAFLREFKNAAGKRRKPFDYYPLLLQLKIRRFVTTNYDLEIENALTKESRLSTSSCDLLGTEDFARLLASRDRKRQPLEPFTSRNSFTQEQGCAYQLSYIPLAISGSRYTNFHCHGRMDDPENCIITEYDYKRWYLEDEDDVRSLQQTMEVLFGSNSLLLLGYGMNDSELMHTLQLIHARRSHDPSRSPLFVLLFVLESEQEDLGLSKASKPRRDAVLKDICDSLYERYGAHVIPFLEGNQTLPNKLKRLPMELKKWNKGIRQKPLLKTFAIPDSKSYFHYKFKEIDKSNNASPEYEKLSKAIKRQMEENRGRFLVVLGEGGAGKTWSAQRFAIEILNANQTPDSALGSFGLKRGCYFWSSYYTNDAYTGLKRAVKFDAAMKGHSSPSLSSPKDILSSFEKILKRATPGHLFVFDGIERLLRPDDANITNGRAISEDVRRFLGAIANCRGAFVILTSKLWPLDLEMNDKGKPLGEDERVAFLKEHKILVDRSRSNCADTVHKIFNRKQLSSKTPALWSLLNGHIYCLSLVGNILAAHRSKVDMVAGELIETLANTPPHRRTECVIRQSIKHANMEVGGDLAAKVLERVALFLNPLEQPVLEVCIQLASPKISNKLQEQVIKSLLKYGLLLEIEFNDEPFTGYTLHPITQTYVRKLLHHSVFSSQPNMLLPGFTSAFEIVDPGSEAGRKVSIELFDNLCAEAETVKSKKEAAIFCRSAYGVLRSRFCSNTVSRWGNYHEYREMLYKLYDAARAASPDVWDHADMTMLSPPPPLAKSLRATKNHIRPDDARPNPDVYIKHSDAPLYHDELAWVCNEMGLVAYSMGNMRDTMFLWQQAYEVNDLLDGDSHGIYRFQSHFNLGCAFIHLGNLYQASTYLDEALRLTYEMNEEEDLRGRVLGYFGLLKYLQGNLDDAKRDFEQAFDLLRHNPRGLSVFKTYYGELMLKMGEIGEARTKILQSRTLAQGAYFPDLVAYSQLANANLLTAKKQYTEAQREYSSALGAAIKFGLRRLEAGVLSGMSGWSYALNDSEGAREKAIAALKVANETSLGLHQTLGLLKLGRALLLSNRQRDMGIAHLRSALHLAKTQGYFLRSAEVEEELLSLGEKVDSDKWNELFKEN